MPPDYAFLNNLTNARGISNQKQPDYQAFAKMSFRCFINAISHHRHTEIDQDTCCLWGRLAVDEKEGFKGRIVMDAVMLLGTGKQLASTASLSSMVDAKCKLVIKWLYNCYIMVIHY